MSLMRIAFACFVLPCILLSCSKELSHDTGFSSTGTGGSGGSGNPGGSGNSGGLLVKIVTTSPLETTTTNFKYDANKKLIHQTVTVQGPASQADFRRHITRDNGGKITFVIDSSLQPGGIWEMDSSRFYYSSNTLLYAITVNYDGSIVHSTDSVTFTYSGSNITKTISYHLSSGSYSADKEHIYVYDGAANVTSYKYYDVSSSASLLTEEKYTYDNKVSPLNWSVESILLNAVEGFIDYGGLAFGPNNPTKVEEVDHAGGGITKVFNNTYTYLSNNKPGKVDIVMTIAGIPIPITSTSTYFYN